MLAYRGCAERFYRKRKFGAAQPQLFEHFIEAMFRRRLGKRRYNSEQTMRWLSSLTGTLTRNNRTVFYLESLDFEWLPTLGKQWLARAGLIVASGLIGG
jgi:hypothetical protein